MLLENMSKIKRKWNNLPACSSALSMRAFWSCIFKFRYSSAFFFSQNVTFLPSKVLSLKKILKRAFDGRNVTFLMQNKVFHIITTRKNIAR